MTKLFRILALALCFSTLASASAQLVFVPDVQFRARLNSLIPGVVDPGGYIDSNGALALGVQEIETEIDWTTADLTGLEAFTALDELYFMNDSDVTALNIPAWPPNMAHLQLSGNFSSTWLPPFPSTLEYLQLDAIHDLTALPALASISDMVSLSQLTHLLVVPAVADSLDQFAVYECGALQSITNMPSVADVVSFWYLPLTTLPACPDHILDQLSISDFPNLIEMPELPDTVNYRLQLHGLDLIDSIPQLPLSCPRIELMEMTALEHLGNLPTDLQEIYMENGGPTCLFALPASVEIFDCFYCGLTCVPNLPLGTTTFVWDGQLLPPAAVPLCNPLNTTCESFLNGIGGRVFVDSNGSGVFDAGEPLLSGAAVQTAPGNWLSGTNVSGMYDVGVPLGSYTITCTSAHPYAQSIAPAQHMATFPAWAGVDTLNDFAVTLPPNIQDLVVDVTCPLPPVPGFDRVHLLSYRNSGTQAQDGSITFTYDAVQTLVSSVPVPDAINGTNLTWNFTQLGITEQRGITIVLNTPVGTALGTAVTHTATAGPLATDQTPADNTYTVTDTVVGSYDPNDKTVEPAELTTAEVAAGERVNYTVRFQNTGTFQATRVIITDTLSSDLQWGTMQLVAASHMQTWFIHDGVLHVIFDNINLPDSNANEPASHGFVKFSMVPVNSLMLGASVSNTANIYFDFNEPVITNAAVFTVDDEQAVEETFTETLTLSPNPVSDVLNIALDKSAANLPLTVVDLTGRVVLTGFVNGTHAQLEVQALKAGSYQLRLSERLVGRFVKR